MHVQELQQQSARQLQPTTHEVKLLLSAERKEADLCWIVVAFVVELRATSLAI